MHPRWSLLSTGVMKIREEQVCFWLHCLVAVLIVGCWFMAHNWTLMARTTRGMAVVGAPLAGITAFFVLRITEGMKYGCALKIALGALVITLVVFTYMVRLLLERIG